MNAALRTAAWHLPVVALAAICALVLMFLAGDRGAKLIVVVLGAAVIAGGALASGNIRLFCLWGFILTLPFDLSYRLGPVYAKLGGETAFRIELSDIFWIALLGYLARDLWTGTLRGVRIPKVTYLWIAIAMLGFAAVIAGPWRMTALHETARMGKMVFIFVVLCNELRTPGRFLQVALALAAAVVIQAGAGITQYVTGSPFGLAIFGEADVVTAGNVVESVKVTRVGAFMIHPVIFASFLATVLPVALALALVRTGPWRRALFAAAIVLGVPALILTLSRAGWLTFFVTTLVLAILVLFRPGLRRKALIPLAGAAAVMFAVLVAFSGPITARLFQSNPESEIGRDEWRGDALRMMSAKPLFGWGLNSYAFAVPPFTRLGARGARDFYEKARLARTQFIPVVHNAYLQWLAEIGAVGLALHLAIFAALIHMGLRNLRVRHELLFLVNAACLAGIVGYLVDLNFGNSLRQGSTLREFWLLAALVCGVHYWRLQDERAPRPAPALPEAAIAAGQAR